MRLLEIALTTPRPTMDDPLDSAWKKRFGGTLRAIPRGDELEVAEAASVDAEGPISRPPVSGPRARLSGEQLTLRGNAVVRRGAVPEPSITLPIPALMVLGLVDERLTVREIVDASGLPDDVALDALRELCERALVRVGA
jgi:hypothetical protein